MQVQDRIGLPTVAGLQSSMIPPLNGVGTSNSAKRVISPNQSSTHSTTHEQGFGSASSIPLVRSRTAPNGQQYPLPQIERSRSHGDSSIDNNHWTQQQQQPRSPSPRPVAEPSTSEPDSQEQALFEERLCEDIYGVAVRKINQNGKSNLRYVKCLYVDASEVLNMDDPSNNPQHYSSNRSVSSRHSRSSRVSLTRFLNKSSHHRTSNGLAVDQDDHRSLLESDNSITNNKSPRSGRVRVLSWGKKKEVTVPLHMFTAVKKGKVNDRTRRNPCDSSRILSLVTTDIHSTNERHHNNSVSLDIEAPTRLDRDKFAKAFARFLTVPVIEEDNIIRSHSGHPAYVSTAFPQKQHNHRPPPASDGNRSIARSIKSETTAQSWRDSNRQSVASSVNNDNSVPDNAPNSVANSEKMNQSSTWKHLKAPLPVVTTKGRSGAKPPRNNRRSTSSASSGIASPALHPGIAAALNNSSNHSKGIAMNGNSSRAGSEADDPPLASLPSSTDSRGASNKIRTSSSRSKSTTPNRKMVLEFPPNSKFAVNSKPNHGSTPATSHVLSHSTSPPMPTPDSNKSNQATDEMEASVVSSITGVGFDQDLVEELHLALEKMKVELEESRAEASRAVKVAEQAIQSAENSSSKDWNNTVTHKAAEAAASAQKKSAEAMAKARIAEERLEIERKAGALRKKQVQDAEQLAAHWQTRAAAAEVQRFAVAEALESVRKKNADLLQKAEAVISGSSTEPQQFDPFEKIKPETELAEVDRLRSKLAMESARRRKLLDELQDLRGSIRVYCRLMEPTASIYDKKQNYIDMVSNEVLMLHRDRSSGALQGNHSSSPTVSKNSPMCFEFDGILASDVGQQDVYAEFEAVCASVLEGFKICVMSYGEANAGKTHTMLGDIKKRNLSVSIENEGIHLRAAKQLFSLLEHRKGKFEHTVTMDLVEVHDEKLTDLLAGTDFGETNGKVESRKSSRRSAEEARSLSSRDLKQKLEIKTNRDGETVVRGVLSVDLASYEDVLRVWTESLAKRHRRLLEQNVEDPAAYEKDSHVVATLRVTSKNIATGSIANGKMQFVDFASSNVTAKKPLGSSLSNKLLSSGVSCEQLLEDWKFTNKSLNIVREVVLSRSQYQRSVPYRNSTITHLLSDSLEADTKVVLIACVSTDEKDQQNTACTLQLAQEMRKVIVGKATRHTTIAIDTSNSI